MINHGIVRSTDRPASKVIDDYSVWVHTDIAPMSEDDFEGYEFRMVQYGKDEYIRIMDENNTAQETRITHLQLALCELYEEMM